MAVTVNIQLIPCGKCASPSLGKATAATRAAPPIPAMLPVCVQCFHHRAAMLGIFNLCVMRLMNAVMPGAVKTLREFGPKTE